MQYFGGPECWKIISFILLCFLSDDLPELDDETNQIAIKHKSTAGPLWL